MNWSHKTNGVYFNWASQTLVSAELAEELGYNQSVFNGLSISGGKGYDELSAKMERGRKAIASILNLSGSDRIVFTSGAVHGLEIICRTIFREKPYRVYTTNHEFPAVLATLRSFVPTMQVLPFTDILETLENTGTDPEPSLFVLSEITYDTGAVLPLQEVTSLIRKKFPNAILVIDGSQAVGNVRTDLRNAAIDAYIFNTNKWLLGTYVGLLAVLNTRLYEMAYAIIPSPYALKERPLQEKCSSSGLNLAYAASVYPSLEHMKHLMEDLSFSNYKKNLKLQLMEGLEQNKQVMFADAHYGAHSSGIVSFYFNGQDDQSLIELWKQSTDKGLYFQLVASASGGRVPVNMFRLALHLFNTGDEVARVIRFFDEVTNSRDRSYHHGRGKNFLASTVTKRQSAR
jgi:selenocysteine lyase/cysteine desulfurase